MTWIFTTVLVKETRTIESINEHTHIKASLKKKHFSILTVTVLFPKSYTSKERHCQLETQVGPMESNG